MTVTLIKPTPPDEFGVRYAAAFDRVTHVDPYADEAAAAKFLHALLFMGNADAVLVRWDGAAWVPVEVPR